MPLKIKHENVIFLNLGGIYHIGSGPQTNSLIEVWFDAYILVKLD